MFQLSSEERTALRSQTVTSNTGCGGRRTAPYVLTEKGVANVRARAAGMRRFQCLAPSLSAPTSADASAPVRLETSHRPRQPPE
ncbi:ORF6N domain-containing protein [Variovorax boronicumulans]|uniref:ORF6N domain-containing protein n=1 Tax=Variovorax boronicumulans TaxID=436515 RepID=UPI00339598F4